MSLDKNGDLPTLKADGFEDYVHFEYTMFKAAENSNGNPAIQFEDKLGLTYNGPPPARCGRMSGPFRVNQGEGAYATNRTRMMFCQFNC